jgi:HlyD family secretion protein
MEALKMRSWLTIGISLLFLALAGATACAPQGEGEIVEQNVEVVRDDLTFSVSGSGNIEVAEEVNLAFGVGGRIDKIYVEEGDRVHEGDILAELDTDSLELAVTQAQVAFTGQGVAVSQAGLSIAQAEVALRTAEHSLDEARDIYTWPEIEIAEADVDNAEAFLQYVLDRGLSPETIGYARARLTAAEAKLDAQIMSFDTEEVAIKKMEVALAEQSLELAKQSLAQSREILKQAEQALEQAQKDLSEAVITASIGGVIVEIFAEEGDVVSPPSFGAQTIIHLVDLTTLELKVDVDEIDIPGVELNQRVIIDLDALPELQLEGRVSSIDELPREEGGVVLFEATISIEVPEGSGLRVGMSADADIIISEKSNVLLVPSRAVIEGSQGEEIVRVVVDEEIEERAVVTGVSDGFETEIISGLDEGEVVIVERRVG